ncbi:MAG: AAA domain-containing protein [Candidatus Dadabacteria bacterium]|nr:AAA domain-containing protein [Candidatus Dadabacteria bacterium]NIQ13717.1 AAA domain-containing protein [Candidatus Dadabacteria bacterium]
MKPKNPRFDQLSDKLEKLNSCFLNFTNNPDENINMLVKLCGENLHAGFSVYSRLEGDYLFDLGKWNVPKDMPDRLKREDVICNELIKNDSTEPLIIRDLHKSHYSKTIPFISKYNLRTYIGAPVRWNKESVGALCAIYQYDFDPKDENLYFMNIISTAIAVEEDRKRSLEALEGALKEVEDLKNRIQEENIYLLEELRTEHNFDDIIGKSKAIKNTIKNVEKVANTDANVLILGESGTGKELLARAIHNHSKRKERILVKVNCGAISAGLVESELFGHERGAFTGAVEKRIGRFELADKGTIFLDEVSELPLETQVKLLRVLQEGEFERLGSSKSIKVDVRLIAATNKYLINLVEEGKFREDLYYRLNVFPISVPPLRERKDDVKLLITHFVEKYASKLGLDTPKISKDIINKLLSYNWPGNIRELENVIERAVILSKGETLTIRDFPEFTNDTQNKSKLMRLNDLEKDHIMKVLYNTNWVIEGKNGAANILDINPSTLRSRIKKLGIKKPKFSSTEQP